MHNALVRLHRTDAGPVVEVPFIGASWVERSRAYWLRRVVATAGVVLASALAVTLSVLVTRAIGRAEAAAAEVIAAGYAATAVFGLISGHRWAGRIPAVRGRGEGGRWAGPMSVLPLLFVPYLAGKGVMIAVRMFGSRFPGERRAAYLTTQLRAHGMITSGR